VIVMTARREFSTDDPDFGDEAAPEPRGTAATLLEGGADLCGNVLGALQERPSLVLAILAAAIGALAGIWLANRFPRRSRAAELADLAEEKVERASGLASAASGWAGRRAERARDRAEEVGKAASRAVDGRGVGGQVQAGVELIPIAARLLSNPIVQAYVRQMLARRVARTFGR
jgi:hypothetical protein